MRNKQNKRNRLCIRMLQSNLQHCEEAMGIIHQHLSAGKSDIALIQEPYAYGNKVKGLPDSLGTVFTGTRTENPRTCIFINKKFNSILVPELSNRDLTVVYLERKVKEADQPVMVASAYLPYDHPERREHVTTEVKKLVNSCKAEKIPLIIGCDSNAHHIVYGSTNIN